MAKMLMSKKAKIERPHAARPRAQAGGRELRLRRWPRGRWRRAFYAVEQTHRRVDGVGAGIWAASEGDEFYATIVDGRRIRCVAPSSAATGDRFLTGVRPFGTGCGLGTVDPHAQQMNGLLRGHDGPVAREGVREVAQDEIE